MTDIEKILIGLDCIITNKGECKGCPYNIEMTSCITSIAQDAKGIIEKHEYLSKQLADRPEIVRCDKCTMRDRAKMCHIWGRDVKDDDYCAYGKWKR